MTGPQGDHLLPQVPGFRILEEIGRGATSRVFRACQKALDREVALKVITTLGERGEQRALRLFREARLAGALDHPGIVRGIGAGQGDGFCWFAMDYVEGFSVQELLDERGKLPTPEVLDLAESVLDALGHAHARGVVHRDVKPANILIDVDGIPRLLDLGLAKRSVDPSLTQQGGAVGTPQYMSPEQATAPDQVDTRSDLFSVASTVYRSLCGVAPFDGQTVAEVLTRLLNEAPAPPSHHVKGLPQAFDFVLLRGLEKRPHRRYQSAGEFLADIRALREGRTPAAFPRRGLPLLAKAGLAAVLVVGAIAVTLMALDDDPKKDRDPNVHVPTDPTLPVRLSLREIRAGLAATSVDYGLLARVRRLVKNLPPQDPEARAALKSVEDSYVKAIVSCIDRARVDAEEELRKYKTPEPPAEAPKTPDRIVYLVSMLRPELVNAINLIGAPRPQDIVLRQRIDEHVKSVKKLVETELEETRGVVKEDLVRELRHWYTSLREFLDGPTARNQITKLIPPYKRDFLTSAQRKEVEDLRREYLEAVAERPRKYWQGEMAQVAVHLKAKKLRSARSRVDSALDRARDHVPEAKTEAASSVKRIEAAIDAEIRRAQEVREMFVRGGIEGLLEEERKRRIGNMERALDALADPREVPGLQDERELSRRILVVVKAGVMLRETVAGAVPETDLEPPVTFRPRLRGHGFIAPRTLLRREGSSLVARDKSGFERRYAVTDLLPASLLEILTVRTMEAPAGAGAALAYLDGDDDLALEMLASLPMSDEVRLYLEKLARAGAERRLASFDRDSDRDAYRSLLHARRLAGAGDMTGAKEALDQLRRALRRTRGWSGHPFWKTYRAEIEGLEKELETHSRLATDWRAFGKHVAADSERGIVRLRLALGEGAGEIPGVVLPPRAKETRSGVRLTVPHASLASVRPDRLPPLQVKLPPLGDAQIDLRFQLVFDEDDFPPTFLSIALHDFVFVAFDRTLDGRPFRAQELHGLERSLFQERSVGRLGIWKGDLSAYERHARRVARPLKFKQREPISIRLTIDAGGQNARIWIGDRLFSASDKATFDLRKGGLRVSGFPTVRISDLSVDARLRGREHKR
ncbi:MAG: hypothetical protein CMJ83_04520 [Planctomycetes bacterium]|nr:hypothetical protein [Planctomycetota bacterium]